MSTNQEKNRRKKKEKKMPIYKGKEEQKRNSTNKPKEKAVNFGFKRNITVLLNYHPAILLKPKKYLNATKDVNTTNGKDHTRWTTMAITVVLHYYPDKTR